MAEIVKRIGPAGYWCRRCAHCNTIELGCIDDVPIYTCSNPYNGVEKEVPGDENITCTMFKLADKGRYPWGSDEDKVLKYCANDVIIIAEQMAKEKQKELEDKVEKYEKLLIDILNETYNHPQLFEHNIHAYELIPGHIRFLRNSFNTMCDKYDPIYEENTKLKEEIKALKSDIEYKDSQLGVMRLGRRQDNKRWNDLNKDFWFPLCDKLYGTTRVNKTCETILSDISDLKDRADGNYKASIRKDELIKHLRDEKKAKDEEIEKLRFTLGEKTEDLHKLSDNYDEILDKHENLAKKNRELQIRVNDLLFQEKLNKSAFGYDYEEENGKLRVENERLRNMVKSQRNCSSSYYYSALKAEDKIEHIQKEAKKWKNKYKEAYDILETYFKYDLDGMEFDVSYDDINLTLRYSTPNGDKGKEYKYNALVSAYERLKKL